MLQVRSGGKLHEWYCPVAIGVGAGEGALFVMDVDNSWWATWHGMRLFWMIHQRLPPFDKIISYSNAIDMQSCVVYVLIFTPRLTAYVNYVPLWLKVCFWVNFQKTWQTLQRHCQSACGLAADLYRAVTPAYLVHWIQSLILVVVKKLGMQLN